MGARRSSPFTGARAAPRNLEGAARRSGPSRSGRGPGRPRRRRAAGRGSSASRAASTWPRRSGSPRGHQVAGDAVDHVSCSPPTAVATTGTPQAMASSGVMPERLVPGRGDDDVGRPYQRGHVGAGHGPAESHPVGDPGLGGERAQPAHLGVGVERGRPAARRRRPARRPGPRPAPATTSSEPLRSTSRPTHQQPRPLRLARRHRAVRGGTVAGRRRRARPRPGRGSAPMPASSKTSSVQVATTRSTVRPSARSSSIRSAGWCRRRPGGGA